MLIRNAVLFTGEAFAAGLSVRVREGRILEIGEKPEAADGEETLDLAGQYLLPGFVDVHIHAFRGRDTMRGEADVRAMSRELRRLGVAAFCPTTMSAPEAETAAAVRGIRAVMEKPEADGAAVLGAHMEAPFLNEIRAGAQRKEFFRNPDWDLFEKLTGGDPGAVRLMTLAPERPGSEAFIRRACREGIRISLGHTAADAETFHRAADWGADHATHLFNAMAPLGHRAPGGPGAALADERFRCEMICDGIHLHRDTVRVIARCKGPAMALAVTDAMEAAGMPEGCYRLGGQEVLVSGGAARLRDGTLAGSVLTMPRALENLIHRFGIPPADACAMCTSAPAASVGEKLAGRMVPGAPGILTAWSPDWQLARVI